MLDELIASQMLFPLLAVVGLVLAVLAFRLGWGIRSFGARRRETQLQKDIRDAKGTVPQLEANLRSREQLVARLQDELQKHADLRTQWQSERAEKERQLRALQTEVRHLGHELSAIKGKSIPTADIDLDLLGHDATVDDAQSSALAEKLKQTEALYEKLKAALIERSQRIDVLERQLKDAAEQGTVDAVESVSSDTLTALERQLDQRNKTISELNAEVAQLRQEKDMIETLAQRRSRSNRQLKDSKTDVEARKSELEQAVVAHQKTISDRELSIHRLLNELQTTRKSLRDTSEEVQSLTRALQTQEEVQAELREERVTLERLLAERDAQLRATLEDLGAVRGTVDLLQDELAELTRVNPKASAGTLVNGLSPEKVLSPEKDMSVKKDGWTAGRDDLLAALDETMGSTGSRAAAMVATDDAADPHGLAVPGSLQTELFENPGRVS